MNYKDIKDFNTRCEEHPDHQSGMITNAMIQQRLHEEIDELRNYIEQAEKQEPSGYLKAGYYFFPSNPIPRSELIPRKEWVGLTKDEVLTTWLSSDTRKVPQCDKHHHFYVAIEAKLKEKNA